MVGCTRGFSYSTCGRTIAVSFAATRVFVAAGVDVTATLITVVVVARQLHLVVMGGWVAALVVGHLLWVTGAAGVVVVAL